MSGLKTEFCIDRVAMEEIEKRNRAPHSIEVMECRHEQERKRFAYRWSVDRIGMLREIGLCP